MALERLEQEKFRSILKAEKLAVEKRKSLTRSGILEATHSLRSSISLTEAGEWAESNSRLEVNCCLCQSFDQILKKIELALKRIEKGIFGECISMYCQNELSMPRLKAMPWADKCLPCQEAEENELAISKPYHQVQVDGMV